MAQPTYTTYEVTHSVSGWPMKKNLNKQTKLTLEVRSLLLSFQCFVVCVE